MSLIPSFFGGRRTNVFDPFSLDLWDPFPSFPISSSAREISEFTNARIDWKETPEAHVFKAGLPGLKKEEVKVEVEEGGILQISGERSKEQEEKNDKWHHTERSSGKFLRRFRLPENAKLEEVKASMENGVLTVTVPKAAEKQPQVKSIDISGSDELFCRSISFFLTQFPELSVKSTKTQRRILDLVQNDNPSLRPNSHYDARCSWRFQCWVDKNSFRLLRMTLSYGFVNVILLDE